MGEGTEVTAIAHRGHSVGVLDAQDSETWALVGRKAEALSKSTIVPEDYRGKPNNCLVAMEMAHRTGLPVLAVMQNLNLIKGRPSWSSQFLIASINSCGRFSPVRFEFHGTEGTDEWRCRMVATSLEDGEQLPGEWISIAMAKAEGWYSRKDRHGNETSKWQTMPGQMLRYRSAAFWARVYAPELAVGLRTADESEDMGRSPAQRRETLAAVLDASDDELGSDPDWETVEQEVREKQEARQQEDEDPAGDLSRL